MTLAAALLIAMPVQAFRCGNELVSEGDRKYDVISKCGEPDFRDSHAKAYLEGIGPVDVVERWYYDPGPGSLVRVLTFRQGRLRSIKTEGRGFGESATGHYCKPRIIEKGMSKYELLQRCGEPVARDRWLGHHGAHDLHRHGRAAPVVVEEWTYTFGAGQFRRFVKIVRGRVVAVATGERGE